MKRIAGLAAMLLSTTVPVFANDTMAELKTGGLSYVQTLDVTMEQEDLFLSMDEVRVDYVFRNTGTKDVESVIAFPMPDIIAAPDSMAAIPDMEADNFLGFTVQQDGKPITPQLQQQVLAVSVDHSDEVRRHNIPFLPYSDKTLAALKALPPEVTADWVSKGLLMQDTYDAGKGWVTDYTPAWTLRSVYWWKTRFPAGKTVRVSHRYKPSVGGTVALSFISEGKPASSYSAYKTRYCLDDAFMKTAAKLEKAATADGPNYTEGWLSYVLTTGANWGGPIGKFKLTIDKGKPGNFVSFCAEGVKKTGPTTFTVEKTDYWPEKDLDILFLLAPSVN